MATLAWLWDRSTPIRWWSAMLCKGCLTKARSKSKAPSMTSRARTASIQESLEDREYEAEALMQAHP
jgi:hypothetical protein